MDNHLFLKKIKSGEISIEEGLKYLSEFNFKDIDIAKLDFQRRERKKFGEVIFSEGKEDFALVKIFKAFYERGEEVLATRATKSQFEIVKKEVACVEYDEISKIIKLEFQKKKGYGEIAILSAGTADLNVAMEAKVCAEFFGSKVKMYQDVGVSGIHRLLTQIDEIKKANVVIAIAGMEGALATVVAGLCDKPIIAVPTSVGYGANFKGLSALLTMLNSCSEGVSVVNIDNGFGAAYSACQINRLIEKR